MKGISFRVPGRPKRPKLGVTSLQHDSPGTREWSALVPMVRQIFEQIFIGCSSTVWLFWMKPTPPQPRLPFKANPSLVTQNKYAL